MISVNKIYTDPKISPESLDVRKDWYVWFRYFDASTDSWKQLRYKKDINNYKTFKERLANANALRQLLKDELDTGWNPVNNITDKPVRIYSIEEAINHILLIKGATLKPKSKYAYTYISKNLLDWLGDRNLLHLHVKKFTGRMAQEYMDNLLLTKKYSGRTFNDHLIILRTFFNCFIEREWVDKNPFRSVKRKTQVIGRNLAYTDKEKELLEKELYEKDRRMYYFSQFVFHCFIRRTEMVSLKVKHIDIINKTIVIPGENTKNRHQESVVIPSGLEPVLKEMQLDRYNSEDYIFGRLMKTSERKFHNPDHISTRHNTFVKKLKMDPDKGLYSWKHTGVCHYYYATKKDIYAIMRQLRHRDLNTTQIYLKSLGLIQNDAFMNAMVA